MAKKKTTVTKEPAAKKTPAKKTAAKTKPETKDIPVIFLSSHNEVMYKSLGLGLGAVDYITKPYEPSLLLKRIEAHLA